MSDTATTVCFTGPLPHNLYGYEHDSYIPMVESFKNIVTTCIGNGYNTFITGGAQGVDQLAFWAVNRVKTDNSPFIGNVMYIPFAGQERRWRDTGLFSKSEYNLAKQYATDVVFVSEPPDFDDKQAISSAMLRRNRAMVDASAFVIGVYHNDNWANGDRTDPGTAYTLKYAMKQGRHVMVLNLDAMSWKTWQ